MHRRIFIGIPASQEIIKSADDFRREHLDLPVRWIKRKNLHITLVPPWLADYAEIVSTITKLKGSFPVEPFSVRFDSIAFGPNAHRANLIWAKGQAPKQIRDLRLKIYEALGQKLDERLFRMHMTIARVAQQNFSPPNRGPHLSLDENGVIMGEMSRLLLQKAGQRGWEVNWQMRVDRFVLYESRLFPKGAEYEVIEEFRFKV